MFHMCRYLQETGINWYPKVVYTDVAVYLSLTDEIYKKKKKQREKEL